MFVCARSDWKNTYVPSGETAGCMFAPAPMALAYQSDPSGFTLMRSPLVLVAVK